MARALGIGGVFFKSDDQVALREWYNRVLGLDFHGVVPLGVFPDEGNGRFAHIVDPEGRKMVQARIVFRRISNLHPALMPRSSQTAKVIVATVYRQQ